MSAGTTWTHAGGQFTRETDWVRSLVSHGGEEWVAAIPGESIRVRVPAASVEGRYSILESLAVPMTGTPMHTHREDEIFHILEGVLTFEVSGERFDALPGMLVVVPKGAPHAWSNFGDKPTRSMVVFTPGGIDTFFTQLTNLSLPQVVELANQYGVAVVGPPIERSEPRPPGISVVI